MMVAFISIFNIVVFIIFSNVQAQDLAQNLAQGEKIFKTCIECHGERGEGGTKAQGKTEDAPRIAGQFDWYIETSIKQFKNGERSNPTMLPYIAKLSEDDIKAVASFVNGLTQQQKAPEK